MENQHLKNEEKTEFWSANVFCLNNSANVRERSSRCVLLKGHTGDHYDTSGGAWAT